MPVLTICCEYSLAAATAAFVLGQTGKGKEGKKGEKKKGGIQYLGPLPLGSWLILFNCVLYGFTSRMDKAAVRANMDNNMPKAEASALYTSFNCLLMAATTLGGATLAGRVTAKSLAAFSKPDVLPLLLGVVASDGVYKLAMAMVSECRLTHLH